VGGFVRLQAHKTSHTVTKQARKRARPGEEATREKPHSKVIQQIPFPVTLYKTK